MPPGFYQRRPSAERCRNPSWGLCPKRYERLLQQTLTCCWQSVPIQPPTEFKHQVCPSQVAASTPLLTARLAWPIYLTRMVVEYCLAKQVQLTGDMTTALLSNDTGALAEWRFPTNAVEDAAGCLRGYTSDWQEQLRDDRLLDYRFVPIAEHGCVALAVGVALPDGRMDEDGDPTYTTNTRLTVWRLPFRYGQPGAPYVVASWHTGESRSLYMCNSDVDCGVIRWRPKLGGIVWECHFRTTSTVFTWNPFKNRAPKLAVLDKVDFDTGDTPEPSSPFDLCVLTVGGKDLARQ